MQYSPTLKGGIVVASVLAATLFLRAQGPEASSSEPAKEAQGKEAPVRAVGLPPRPAPTDYQARVKAGMVTIAADFHGHNVPTEEAGPYSTEDFVVLEVAVFGQPDQRLQISPDQFSLRVNGKKNPLPSQSYLTVFHSLKDPSWEPPENTAKSKTTLNTGGGGSQDDLPAIVHMPMQLRHAMEQRVIKSSFPEGERPLPQAGLLFFEHHGQTKSIRSVELTYSGPAGKATMALQP